MKAKLLAMAVISAFSLSACVFGDDDDSKPKVNNQTNQQQQGQNQQGQNQQGQNQQGQNQQGQNQQGQNQQGQNQQGQNQQGQNQQGQNQQGQNQQGQNQQGGNQQGGNQQGGNQQGGNQQGGNQQGGNQQGGNQQGQNQQGGNQQGGNQQGGNQQGGNQQGGNQQGGNQQGGNQQGGNQQGQNQQGGNQQGGNQQGGNQQGGNQQGGNQQGQNQQGGNQQGGNQQGGNQQGQNPAITNPNVEIINNDSDYARTYLAADGQKGFVTYGSNSTWNYTPVSETMADHTLFDHSLMQGFYHNVQIVTSSDGGKVIWFSLPGCDMCIMSRSETGMPADDNKIKTISYKDHEGNTISQNIFIEDENRNDILAYARFGSYIDPDTQKMKLFYQGQPTEINDMPKSGTASYSGMAGAIDGDNASFLGRSDFRADFTNKKLTGYLALWKGETLPQAQESYENSPGTPNKQVKIEADISGNTFKGTKNNVSSEGKFYGPKAQNIAGAFSDKKQNLQGVFGANKQ